MPACGSQYMFRERMNGGSSHFVVDKSIYTGYKIRVSNFSGTSIGVDVVHWRSRGKLDSASLNCITV